MQVHVQWTGSAEQILHARYTTCVCVCVCGVCTIIRHTMFAMGYVCMCASVLYMK